MLPAPVKHWTLTTLREKLIKVGAKVMRHSKYVMSQLAESAFRPGATGVGRCTIAKHYPTPESGKVIWKMSA